MTVANQPGAFPLKRMGTSLRNMGLASLLVFVIPVIGLWYFYLAGQMAVAARDAYNTYNDDKYHRVKKVVTANLIVSGTFFLLAVAIWLAAVPVLMGAMGGGSSLSSMQYFSILAWGCGSCIAAWGVISAAMNIGLWSEIQGIFKAAPPGDLADSGIRGCRLGIAGSVLGLATWLVGIAVVVFAGLFTSNIASGTYPSSETNFTMGMGVVITFMISGLHGAASACTNVTALFKTGTATRQLDALLTPGRIAASASDTLPVARNAPPRVLFDATSYFPEETASANVIAGVVPTGVMDNTAHVRPGPPTADSPTMARGPSPAAHDGLGMQFCAHCGNPFKVDPDTGRCEYCGEKVITG